MRVSVVLPVRKRVQLHRQQLRARGLRPIQIWVPDVRARSFKDEARRQSHAVAEADRHDDILDFLDAIDDPWTGR